MRLKELFQVFSVPLTLAAGMLLCGCRVGPDCVFRPVPHAWSEMEVTGLWIGFPTTGTDLYRLELGAGHAGALTQAHTGFTNQEIMRLEISRWEITPSNVLTCAFRPCGADDPYKTAWPVKMTCDVWGDHLEATLQNGEGGWKQSIVFWRESDFDEKLKGLRQ